MMKGAQWEIIIIIISAPARERAERVTGGR
jgi:hypothetical protein